MIPIWVVIIIAFVSCWAGFFLCALLTIGRDAPSDRYLNIKDKSAELGWTDGEEDTTVQQHWQPTIHVRYEAKDEVDDVVHMKDMEANNE